MAPVLGPENTEHARQVAENVLSAPEYRGPELGTGLLDRISRFLESLFDKAVQHVADMPRWLTWIVVAWIALTLLGIAGHALYTLFVLGGSGPVGAKARTRPPPRELFGIRDLDFERVRVEAIEARRRGDWGRAIRYGYAAQILLFDRLGFLSFDVSKTNRDYVRELSPRESEASEFRRATDVFEDVAYGGAAPTETAAHAVLCTLENFVDGRLQPV